MTTPQIDKYRRGWTSGLPETLCGFGSMIDQTEIQREWILRMVGKYGIRTIHDIGAGDLNWIKVIKWPYPVKYRAFDLVPRRSDVRQFDLIHEKPQAVDLTMCLWVLNHMPEDHARVALDNLRASGSKYLMYTYWPSMADFLDLGAIESKIIRTRYMETGDIDFEIRLIRC